MSRVYLCARYSRNAEMRSYAADLGRYGYYVQAEWITGSHDQTPDEKCAAIDWKEVTAADIVISFTEPPGPVKGRGRGGRHVEFGAALAMGKRCIVVGHRENVFHHMPHVEFYPSWQACFGELMREGKLMTLEALR